MKGRLLGALVWILGRTPLLLLDGLAFLLVWAWWFLVPVRKTEALANLALAFPERDAPSRRALLRRSVRDMVRGYFEILHVVRTPALLGRFVTFENQRVLLDAVATGRGCLLLCGHSSAWDLGLIGLSTIPGLRVTIVVRPPRDPWTAAFIERVRRIFGVRLLAPRGSKDEVYSALADGDVVLLPFDQRQDNGIAVPFFGRDALTAPSLAAMARRSGRPVIGAWSERLGPRRLVVRFYDGLDVAWTDDRSADLVRATSRYNAFIEERIREIPHGWLWLHLRWRMPSPR